MNIPNGNVMLNELRLLNYNDAAILNQIRMGYMTLHSDVPWFDTSYYECNCELHPRLTIQHYFLECTLPKLVEARTNLQHYLSQLNSKFEDNDYFNNMNHLLYPHLEYTSKELKTIENIFRRHEHLKGIIQFCRYRFPD